MRDVRSRPRCAPVGCSCAVRRVSREGRIRGQREVDSCPLITQPPAFRFWVEGRLRFPG